MNRPLPATADDGWDMSPRRETAVMRDMPTSFETFEQSARKPVLRGKLSSAEIEALLRPDLSDMAPEPAPPPPKTITPRPIPDLDQPHTARADLPEDALRPACCCHSHRRVSGHIRLGAGSAFRRDGPRHCLFRRAWRRDHCHAQPQCAAGCSSHRERLRRQAWSVRAT